MRISTAFHPLIFAVYPIFSIYSANMAEIRLIDAVLPAILSLLVVLAILLFLNRLLKNPEKAALLVSSGCFAFYAYSGFEYVFISFFGLSEIRGVWLPLLWLAAFLFSSFQLLRTRAKLALANSFYNVASLVLILMVSANITWFHLTGKSNQADMAEGSLPNQVLGQFKIDPANKTLPDIYYLIFDGYARQDILKDTYGAENSEFSDFLTDNGFYVASQSFTNYPQTYLSLASSLNFNYLDSLSKQYADQNSVQPLIKMIRNNMAFAILKKSGYSTYAFASGYSGTELREVDHYLSRTFLGQEFIHTLVNATFLSALKLPFFDVTATETDIHRERIKDTLKSIADLKVTAGPVIVFSHILCPHPPFVFGKNGESVNYQERFNLQDGSHWGHDFATYRRQYAEQLHYFSKLVKDSLAPLVKDKSRPRIIILQSDHGPGSMLDWQNIEKTDLRERFGILNAIYCSDGDYSEFYPQMSPVNTFRFVLNRLHTEKLPLLPDRSYFAPWFGRYRFVEVTDRLKNLAH